MKEDEVFNCLNIMNRLFAELYRNNDPVEVNNEEQTKGETNEDQS